MQNTPPTVEVSEGDAERLRDLVSDEISADMSVSPEVAATILAAFPDTAPSGPGSGGVLAGMFLRSITVNGFRGIGPKTTLDLQPAPGLTLVIGRNGCGKFSFATCGSDLRLERVRSAEPEHLEQTAASARATVNEHLEADHDLASRLRDVQDRHTVLRVTEVHRQLAGRKLTKNREALSHMVDSFIEARALQIGSWEGADNATIREAWSLARDRAVAATNSGRRQLSAGAIAVARWVEPKDAAGVAETPDVTTVADDSKAAEKDPATPGLGDTTEPR
ncbi:hypothetical protein [Nocardia nova]|uniref:hypothetical protein n=1 Tax=Nocardia nova TaxID=37330 RepID=UPI0027385238|nr:hypothetical protein [Nocardia nova]